MPSRILNYTETYDRLVRDLSNYPVADVKLKGSNPTTPDIVCYVIIGTHNIEVSIGQANNSLGRVPINLTVYDDEANIKTKLSGCVFSLKELNLKLRDIKNANT